MVGELAALRCACGHNIAVELRDKRERICNVVFFDSEPTSDSYGQRIRRCPCCGVELDLFVLKALDPSD